CLDIAVEHNDTELARWVLEHGADPNAIYPPGSRRRRGTLYEEAGARGHLAVAHLLAKFGSDTGKGAATAEEQFVAASKVVDVSTMRRLVADRPALLELPTALFAAAQVDNVTATTALLDLGVSPDVQDDKRQRALHVAAYANALGVARLLIDRGAEIDPVEENW